LSILGLHTHQDTDFILLVPQQNLTCLQFFLVDTVSVPIGHAEITVAMMISYGKEPFGLSRPDWWTPGDIDNVRFLKTDSHGDFRQVMEGIAGNVGDSTLVSCFVFSKKSV
jgi:hypothetical protein